MVEDNAEFKKHRGNRLRLSLYKKLSPCPCSSESRIQNAKCCDSITSRMKSLVFQCNMVKILLFQSIFKPMIVYATCWICIIVVYNIACVFAPIVYLIYAPVFTDHYWCPFGDTDCEDDDCRCLVVPINSFGGALLFGGCAFLLLPLTLHINNLFAKMSKGMSYFWLTNRYYGNPDPEKGGLLNNANNHPIRDTSVSIDRVDNSTQGGVDVVHSINNPYNDPQV